MKWKALIRIGRKIEKPDYMSTDREETYVLNVMVRIMESHKPLFSVVLPSKRLDKRTAKIIAKEKVAII